MIITRIARSLKPNDEVALYTFYNLTVQPTVPFTTEKEEVIKALETIRPHGETALYQAINSTLSIMGRPQNRQAASSPQSTRRSGNVRRQTAQA